jgi:hypothetical protein
MPRIPRDGDLDQEDTESENTDLSYTLPIKDLDIIPTGMVKRRSVFFENIQARSGLHRGLSKKEKNIKFIHQTSLVYDEGLSIDFTELWQKLAFSGVVYSARFKPRGLKNNRNDPSAPKKMKMKPKSAHPKNVYFGHLPIDKSQPVERPENTPEHPEVKYVKFKGDIVPVTFERQTINLIRTKIESGEYELVACDLNSYDEHLGIHVPKIIIRTPIINPDGTEGIGTYVIRLAEFGQATDLKPTVNNLIKRFEHATDETNAAMLNFKILMQKPFVNDNMEKTVKILRFDPEQQMINEEPHILSDEYSNPIKGDVDMQNTLLPDYLPAKAFRFIRTTDPEELIQQFRSLLYALSKQDRSARRIFFITSTIDKAISRLQGQIQENPKFAKEMIEDIGVINLFNAAMVLGLNTDILHGPEAGSPIWPENITVTILPNAADRDRQSFLRTHSEFEQIKLLHTQDKILDRKIMDFNPCWFVKAQVENSSQNWRKDLSVADTTRQFPCKNLTDEDVSIEMWKLLFEKQLLNYMKAHSEQKFSEYVNVIIQNFADMPEHPLSKATTPKGLPETLIAGTKVAEQIIAKVQDNFANGKVKYIDSRLQEIKDLSSQPDSDLKSELRARIEQQKYDHNFNLS